MADFASELAKKPPAVKLGILLGVCAALGLVYWQLYYSSMSEELESAKTRYSQLQQENKRYKQQLDEWEDLVLQKGKLDEKLKNNQVSLPDASELPAFFAYLQKQAAASGVTITTWKRAKETKVETYYRVPVDVEIVGTFYQINKYFHLLFQTERIISVEDLSLKNPVGRGDEIVLKAKFVASTYRAEARPKTPAQSGGANRPAGGGAKPAGDGAKPAGDGAKTGGAGTSAESRLNKIKDDAKEKVEKANEKTEADADKAAGVKPEKGAGQ